MHNRSEEIESPRPDGEMAESSLNEALSCCLSFVNQLVFKFKHGARIRCAALWRVATFY